MDVSRFKNLSIKSVAILCAHVGVFCRCENLVYFQRTPCIQNLGNLAEQFCREPFPLPAFAFAFAPRKHLPHLKGALFVGDRRDAIARFGFDTGIFPLCLFIVSI